TLPPGPAIGKAGRIRPDRGRETSPRERHELRGSARSRTPPGRHLPLARPARSGITPATHPIVRDRPMHDIRLIREAPAAFDTALGGRNLPAMSSEFLGIDEIRRARILASEQALAERNAASKAVGAAKARGDNEEFERLRALVADKKDEIARLETEAAEADAQLREQLAQVPNLPLD